MKAIDIKLINWSCDICYDGVRRVKKDSNEKKKVMNYLKDQVKKLVNGKIQHVLNELFLVGDVIRTKSD